MIEYTRRIVAFSLVAILLGISISIGIAYLPIGPINQSKTTQQVPTLASTTTTSSVVSTVTSSTFSTSQAASSTSTTTVLTTIGGGTTVLTTVSTVVSSTLSSNTGNSTGVSTSTTTSVTCSVSGYPYGVELQVITDSGTPVSGLAVSGQAMYTVNGQICSNKVAALTNSTGWAYLGSNPGYYYVSFSYSGAIYNLTIPSRPVTESIARYYVPSGNLTIEYCTYGNVKMCSG